MSHNGFYLGGKDGPWSEAGDDLHSSEGESIELYHKLPRDSEKEGVHGSPNQHTELRAYGMLPHGSGHYSI